jgi:hypothetical protein
MIRHEEHQRVLRETQSVQGVQDRAHGPIQRMEGTLKATEFLPGQVIFTEPSGNTNAMIHMGRVGEGPMRLVWPDLEKKGLVRCLVI